MGKSSGSGFVAVLVNPLSESGLLRPVLSFLRTNGMLELSWLDGLFDFDLMETDNLSPPVQWTPSASTVTRAGDTLRAPVEGNERMKFYRLERNAERSESNGTSATATR